MVKAREDAEALKPISVIIDDARVELTLQELARLLGIKNFIKEDGYYLNFDWKIRLNPETISEIMEVSDAHELTKITSIFRQREQLLALRYFGNPKGWGVVALQPLASGTILGEYTGEYSLLTYKDSDPKILRYNYVIGSSLILKIAREALLKNIYIFGSDNNKAIDHFNSLQDVFIENDTAFLDSAAPYHNTQDAVRFFFEAASYITLSSGSSIFAHDTGDAFLRHLNHAPAKSRTEKTANTLSDVLDGLVIYITASPVRTGEELTIDYGPQYSWNETPATTPKTAPTLQIPPLMDGSTALARLTSGTAAALAAGPAAATHVNTAQLDTTKRNLIAILEERIAAGRART